LRLPSLPREPSWTRSLWLALVVLALGVAASSLLRMGAFVDTGASLLRSVQHARSPAAEAAARWFDTLTDFAVVTALRWGSVAVLVVYRRWRHLVVFLATFVAVDWLTVRVLSIERPVPEGVAPLSERAAFWFPSRPVAAFAITVFAMPIVLVPASSRRRALWVAGAAAVLAALSRIVLAADYPVDALCSVALGYSVAAVAFAAFVPGHVFPVSYRRGGKAAHLDLGGERGRAIVAAMREQLGLSVTEVEPFGLEGSGARRRCGCASRNSTDTCSRRSTPGATCGRIAGTGSVGRCYTGSPRTRCRSDR
jgi:membrane-associated phospholipid phosphatase